MSPCLRASLNQYDGLKGLAERLVIHFERGNPPQFIVHQDKHLFGGVMDAALHVSQHYGSLTVLRMLKSGQQDNEPVCRNRIKFRNLPTSADCSRPRTNLLPGAPLIS